MPSSAGAAALAALDKALAARPGRDDYAFADATKHLCILRDALIGARRTGGSAADGLEKLNAVISSVLAGHFPLGETPWPEIQQARAVLAELIAERSGKG